MDNDSAQNPPVVDTTKPISSEKGTFYVPKEQLTSLGIVSELSPESVVKPEVLRPVETEKSAETFTIAPTEPNTSQKADEVSTIADTPSKTTSNIVNKTAATFKNHPVSANADGLTRRADEEEQEFIEEVEKHADAAK